MSRLPWQPLGVPACRKTENGRVKHAGCSRGNGRSWHHATNRGRIEILGNHLGDLFQGIGHGLYTGLGIGSSGGFLEYLQAELGINGNVDFACYLLFGSRFGLRFFIVVLGQPVLNVGDDVGLAHFDIIGIHSVPVLNPVRKTTVCIDLDIGNLVGFTNLFGRQDRAAFGTVSGHDDNGYLRLIPLKDQEMDGQCFRGSLLSMDEAGTMQRMW